MSDLVVLSVSKIKVGSETGYYVITNSKEKWYRKVILKSLPPSIKDESWVPIKGENVYCVGHKITEEDLENLVMFTGNCKVSGIVKFIRNVDGVQCVEYVDSIPEVLNNLVVSAREEKPLFNGVINIGITEKSQGVKVNFEYIELTPDGLLIPIDTLSCGFHLGTANFLPDADLDDMKQSLRVGNQVYGACCRLIDMCDESISAIKIRAVGKKVTDCRVYCESVPRDWRL